MLFVPLKLSGAFLVEPEIKSDERGFFARAFCEREFEQHGLHSHYVQCNISHNTRRGTLRGMHFQKAPHGEIKIVRCIQGRVYDVIIDLRSQSPTKGHWEGIELSAENRRMLYVPDGFAQGFITLQADSQLFYQMSNYYVPDAATGVRWNDPAFNIVWPEQPSVLTERDASYPDYLANSAASV